MNTTEARDHKQTNDLGLRQKALAMLREGDLSGLPGRPFDNRYSIFGTQAPVEGRLLVIGLNGSNIDKGLTNERAIEEGFTNPEESNIRRALKDPKHWGNTRLPNRLEKIVKNLGFDLDQTVFTNAILMCSKDEASIEPDYEKLGGGKGYWHLVDSSMQFMSGFTLRECDPSVVVVHGTRSSNLVYESFSTSKKHRHKSSRAYWFHLHTGNKTLPVLCLWHLSRFDLTDETLNWFKNEIGR